MKGVTPLSQPEKPHDWILISGGVNVIHKRFEGKFKCANCGEEANMYQNFKTEQRLGGSCEQ